MPKTKAVKSTDNEVSNKTATKKLKDTKVEMAQEDTQLTAKAERKSKLSK